MSAACEGVSEMRQSDTNTSKTELERKIRQRVACEERAHRIVEKLLEGPVTDHYLIECGQYITPSHYEDIVEERAIIRLCGYPVCGNSLGKVPQQKYFISTKSNKVYDITERKNFCSNQCFKASRYFERQISTTPVWLRDKEKSETLRVLDPSKNGGSPGLEVVGKKQVSALQREAELLAQDMGDPSETTTTETSVLNPAANDVQQSVPFNSGNTSQDKLKSKSELVSDSESSDEKLSQQLSSNLQIRDSEQSVKDLKINSGKAASETLADGQQSQTPKSAQKTAISKTEYLMQLLNKRQNLLSKMVDDQPEQTIVKKQHSKGESEKANFLQKNAEQGKNLPTEPPKLSIIEKNTEIMSKIRLGAHSSERPEAETDTQKTRHADKDVSGSSFMRKLQTSFPQLSPQMLLICTRLFDWLTEDSLKYLKLIKDDHPNCKPDEKEAEDLTITSEIERDRKVSIKGVTATENERTIEARSENSADFHTIREQSRNFQIKVREFYKGSFTYKPPEGADYQGSGQSDNTSEIVLPPVDSMAQNTLRRKIVLQKVEKSISEMLTPLGLAIQHIATDLRQLVATFSLTSINVILKPAEWSLMSLFLIKMLSLCVPVVWKSFNEGRSLHFFKTFLSALGASLKDVDEILNHIYSEKIQEQKIL